MFGETPIFHVMIWNHPIETSILNWMFRAPGYMDGLGQLKSTQDAKNETLLISTFMCFFW